MKIRTVDLDRVMSSAPANATAVRVTRQRRHRGDPAAPDKVTLVADPPSKETAMSAAFAAAYARWRGAPAQ